MGEHTGVEVRFGLLGPFELRVGGRPVLVRSPRVRCALAALAAAPGRPVPVAELIEAIWGVRQPEHPRRALQVCLTRARATLAAEGVERLIVSASGGYRLEVPPEWVDAARFRRLVESGALAEAVQLWRGEPFADVPSEHLQSSYGVQLVEQWLRAVERLNEAKMAAGRHAEVVGELAELTARYPLRERLWAQYLTALQHSGRRSEALTTYHRLHRRLAEELGVEPEEELQRLHATILSGPGDRVVPRQLPAEAFGFTGRAAEVDRLHRLLRRHERGDAGAPSTLVVTGRAGVGKTTLAAYWCRRVADRFPDGQLWLDLRGSTPPRRAVATLLRALGDADLPLELDDLIGRYRSLMDGRRMLLVLDDARDADQVMPLLPGDARTLVIVTSRGDLTPLVAARGAQVMTLAPLTAGEARHLLVRRLGPEVVDAAAVDRIIGTCRGLPGALALVAARAATGRG